MNALALVLLAVAAVFFMAPAEASGPTSTSRDQERNATYIVTSLNQTLVRLGDGIRDQHASATAAQNLCRALLANKTLMANLVTMVCPGVNSRVDLVDVRNRLMNIAITAKILADQEQQSMAQHAANASRLNPTTRPVATTRLVATTRPAATTRAPRDAAATTARPRSAERTTGPAPTTEYSNPDRFGPSESVDETAPRVRLMPSLNSVGFMVNLTLANGDCRGCFGGPSVYAGQTEFTSRQAAAQHNERFVYCPMRSPATLASAETPFSCGMTSPLYQQNQRIVALYMHPQRFSTIRSRALAQFPNLDTLVLSNGSLSSIQPGAFAGLNRLTFLDLSFNDLLTFNSSLLVGTNIAVLNLRGNRRMSCEGLCDANRQLNFDFRNMLVSGTCRNGSSQTIELEEALFGCYPEGDNTNAARAESSSSEMVFVGVGVGVVAVALVIGVFMVRRRNIHRRLSESSADAYMTAADETKLYTDVENCVYEEVGQKKVQLGEASQYYNAAN